MNITEQIRHLFDARGNSQYGGEAVNQREHALQAAALAEREHAPASLVIAALLHDIGHLLHDLHEDAPHEGIDDVHEDRAAKWLKEHFSDEVVEPVRLHVAAKRYLCTVEPSYRQTLSPPSIVSLELQGGAMSDQERRAFEALPHADAAVRLRRWDDSAKVEGLTTPSIGHFLRRIGDCASP